MTRTASSTRGRLIALDGTDPTLTAAAREVVMALTAGRVPRGVSRWDSSGLFTELAAAEPDLEGPSARTLTLVYAADLAFRLRWQILPAIEEGRSVIAAPYVETAKALGVASGLPRKWLDELFRFAPKPDATYHVAGRRARAASGGTKGYVECFSSALLHSEVPIEPADLRTRALDYLMSLEKRRRCTRLSATTLTALSRGARRR